MQGLAGAGDNWVRIANPRHRVSSDIGVLFNLIQKIVCNGLGDAFVGHCRHVTVKIIRDGFASPFEIPRQF